MPSVARSFTVTAPPPRVVDYQTCTRRDDAHQLVFEQPAGDTEKQLSTVVNQLAAKEQQ